MSQEEKQEQPKNRSKKHSPPISLKPLEFEEAVQDLLKVKPPSKKIAKKKQRRKSEQSEE